MERAGVTQVISLSTLLLPLFLLSLLPSPLRLLSLILFLSLGTQDNVDQPGAL
jgi:hypothetical protein